jgi:hypothetical protein
VEPADAGGFGADPGEFCARVVTGFGVELVDFDVAAPFVVVAFLGCVSAPLFVFASHSTASS